MLVVYGEFNKVIPAFKVRNEDDYLFIDCLFPENLSEARIIFGLMLDPDNIENTFSYYNPVYGDAREERNKLIGFLYRAGKASSKGKIKKLLEEYKKNTMAHLFHHSGLEIWLNDGEQD